MNIIEAINRSVITKKPIKNLERNEWLIVSSGTFRWKSTREIANLTVNDIKSISWVCEEDIYKITLEQIKTALDKTNIKDKLELIDMLSELNDFNRRLNL